MGWLQDKKNLPFVIGGLAVALIAVGVFLLISSSGDGADESTTQATSGTSMPLPGASQSEPGMPGMPQPSGASGTPVQSGGPTVTVPGATTQTTDLQAGADASESVLEPIELWRADPFAAAATNKPKAPPPVVRLNIPMPPLIFPQVDSFEVEQRVPPPQPPRRVAGILYGDRVNALIQTPNGWETVRPGDKLADGTLVERIERDRVILRTADGMSRLVEVRLAASVLPLEQPNVPSSTGTSGPRYPGGSPMSPRGGPSMPTSGRPM